MDYIDPRPNTNLGRVRTALMGLIEEHRRDDALPTSARFLFYELIARRVISKSQKAGVRADRIVSEALTDLREGGFVDWESIIDETRELSSYHGSKTVAADLLAYLESACICPWRGRPPLILCESRSLAGALRDLCVEYRCRLASTNGQTGGFLHTKVAPVLTSRSRTLQPDRVGYLGDYDLSGDLIETNTRRVLESIVGDLDWERLALTEEQVEEHDLPRILKADKRFKDGGGEHEAVETEALSQSLIVTIVRDWLDDLLPQPLDRVRVRERRERERLRRLIVK
jgi:hypothetical protein